MNHTEKVNRRDAHQEMLREHKERKALAKERHKNKWHKFKPIPIILV